MAPYVSSAELAASLSIHDADDDVELDRAVRAASLDVDRYCGWRFNQGAAGEDVAAAARTFVASDRFWLDLPDGFWTTSGLVVKIDDDDDGVFETTLSASDYELHPGNRIYDGVVGFPYHRIRAIGDHLWPLPVDRTLLVEVTARWGWETCPEDVKTATLMRAAQVFERFRRGSSLINESTGFRAGGRDRDWQLFLDGYRHPDHMRWCG